MPAGWSCTAHLTDALRACPDLDEAADEAIRLLNIEREGAGEKLAQFRELRECVGGG